MAGKPPHKAAVRTQQKTEATPWGSQEPTLEEIIHKRLCKAAHPHLIQAVSGPRSVQRIFALQALHGDEPTPGSRLLTGAVTGMRQKAKQLPGQGARPGAPRGEGWHTAPRQILTDGLCFTAAETRWTLRI